MALDYMQGAAQGGLCFSCFKVAWYYIKSEQLLGNKWE